MKDTITNIFLVRHGQTLWNLEQRWQGNQNSNLTDLGIQQANITKSKLSKQLLDKGYVSPLQRARDTIQIIVEDRNLEVEVIDDIREINLGPWEGKTQEETSISHPSEFKAFWDTPETFLLQGADTFEELQSRVVEAINHIFLHNEGKNIIVVSHWISIKVALAFYMNKPLSFLPKMPNPQNAEILCLRKIEDKITIV